MNVFSSPFRKTLPWAAMLCLALSGCQQNSRSPVATAPAGSHYGSAPRPVQSSPAPAPGPVVQASYSHPALPDPPHVAAAAYIVIDPRTGKVLLQKNAHQRRQVASTQKLLTALVLLEAGDMEKTVTVDPSDTWVEPVKMGIASGEKYRKRDLLEAMMVRSCNDIAHCLARDHAGSEQRFVAQMNAKARQLGMMNSHFANAAGFTADGQYSTAFDVAILATHALNNDYLHHVTGQRQVTFRFPDGRSRAVTTTNKVLGMTPYCVGMKTGYTNAAGRCLVSVGHRGGKKVIVVVLGSEVPHIWEDSRDLIHWALGVHMVSPT